MSRTQRLHRHFFGTGIGERTLTLLHGLKWTLPAAWVSRVLAGVATVFAARQLGPSRFGEASLALATTFWIQVPLFLGIPAALMRFIPVAKPEEREKWVGTGLLLLTLSGTGTFVIALGLSGVWAQVQGVTVDTFRLGLIWCGGLFLYAAATFAAAARERFRLRAILEILFSFLFLAQILSLWFSKRLDPSVYVTAMAFAYALAGGVGLLIQRPGRFQAAGFVQRSRPFLVFGLITSLGAVANALLQSTGRLIANHYLDVSQVGILSAYQAGSVQMALYFMSFGLHVFMPIASRTPDRTNLFGKLTRLSIPVVGGMSLFCAATLTFYFLILGRRYPLGAAELIMFALASGFAIQHGVLSWFFSSGSSRAVVASVIVSLVAGILNATLGWMWIPRWGIVGAGAAMAAAYMGGILTAYISVVKRYGCN